MQASSSSKRVPAAPPMPAPISRSTNDENRLRTNSKPTPMPTSHTLNRRVLGDVSPNVKVASPIPSSLQNKPVQSSPLKRSFTARLDEETGMSYLKRRRLSADRALSQEGMVTTSGRSVFAGADAMKFTPSLPSPEEEMDMSGNPIIQELSPTEPNTPTNSARSSQDSALDRRSFSSLINYDPSSQPPPPLPTVTLEPISSAQLLRLRLRVAMYKVRTNQINIPFDDLHVEDPAAEVANSAASHAVEAAVAELRREAMSKHAPPPNLQERSFPKLLPAPVIFKPTSHSSRMIYMRTVPSSPPAHGGSLERLDGKQGLATPMGRVEQLSSPPDSAGRDDRMLEEAELTSNAVKGTVAEGILGLRHAV